MMKENKSKSKILVMVMIALMMGLWLAGTARAETNPFPQLTITMINQEPDPVAPGNTVDVKFRIENEGGGVAPDVEIKLVPAYPFSFYGQETETKAIGTLTGYQTGDVGVKADWKLLVDSGAATGDNTIEFWYRLNKGVWTKADDFTISVKSREAVLAINQVKTDQENIVPGTKTKVSFVVENLADNTLVDIKLNLEILTLISSATGVTVRELPFTPIGSGNDKTVKRLAPGQTAEIAFDLFTDSTAESKVYKVPYTLTYSDSSGTNFTKQGIVGLLVESEPELSVNIDKTEIYSAGAKGVVEFKLVNKGFSDIKFLDVKLAEGNDFEILSNQEVYIGKLDSDDYETADYTLMVSNTAKDHIILPLHVEYRDANGGLYVKDLNLSLKLFSGAELKQRTNGKSSPVVFWIILIVVIVAGVLIYRNIRKNKKKKEQK
jgi:hypothetical protein